MRNACRYIAIVYVYGRPARAYVGGCSIDFRVRFCTVYTLSIYTVDRASEAH